jgi:hypothetical protein
MKSSQNKTFLGGLEEWLLLKTTNSTTSLICFLKHTQCEGSSKQHTGVKNKKLPKTMPHGKHNKRFPSYRKKLSPCNRPSPLLQSLDFDRFRSLSEAISPKSCPSQQRSQCSLLSLLSLVSRSLAH